MLGLNNGKHLYTIYFKYEITATQNENEITATQNENEITATQIENIIFVRKLKDIKKHLKEKKAYFFIKKIY